MGYLENRLARRLDMLSSVSEENQYLLKCGFPIKLKDMMACYSNPFKSEKDKLMLSVFVFSRSCKSLSLKQQFWSLICLATSKNTTLIFQHLAKILFFVFVHERAGHLNFSFSLFASIIFSPSYTCLSFHHTSFLQKPVSRWE